MAASCQSACTRNNAAPRPCSAAASTRLYVLDTNVLLHDPYSLGKFAEHDVYIPFVTLEELDAKKSGMQDVNRNARAATRLIEDVVSQPGHTMDDGFPLSGINGGRATGRLFVQRESLPFLAHEHVQKNDNMFLAVLRHLATRHPGRTVVMVTKDINLRVKARALGFTAEDYLHDHAVDDVDLLYRGLRRVGPEFLAADRELHSWKEGAHVYYRMRTVQFMPNEFAVLADGTLLQAVECDARDGTTTFTTVPAYDRAKYAVMGVTARNDEQVAALTLLMNPEVDFVALLGPAGTGKTLLTLAAGLAQTVGESLYDEILFTRATVALGEDIGYLPGTEEEKLAPWLGALEDNLEVVLQLAGKNDIERQKLRERARLVIARRAITFMRGRTFHRKFVVLDEAQNLTPKQVKALVTRAGEGTKVVCLGNLAQIDSPWLTEVSSGLAYAVERLKGWPHFGAVVLTKGERSRLANVANERL